MLLGWFIDSRAGTFPIFALVGLLVGMAAAGYHMYSMFRKFTKD
ncbi:MAG: AtpZ/AtpI family protein [Sciscionella sp.]